MSNEATKASSRDSVNRERIDMSHFQPLRMVRNTPRTLPLLVRSSSE